MKQVCEYIFHYNTISKYITDYESGVERYNGSKLSYHTKTIAVIYNRYLITNQHGYLK